MFKVYFRRVLATVLGLICIINLINVSYISVSANNDMYNIYCSDGKYPIFEGYNTVVFSVGGDWYIDDIRIYAWKGYTETNNSAWPGESMKYALQNEFGEYQFVAYIPVDFDYIIINSDKGEQTKDILLDSSIGLYITGKTNGKWNVGEWSPIFYNVDGTPRDDVVGEVDVWPGMSMKLADEAKNIYYFDIPEIYNCFIFSDGNYYYGYDNGIAWQTDGISFTGNNKLYAPNLDDTSYVNGATLCSVNCSEYSQVTEDYPRRVYFEAPTNWERPSCYCWYSEGIINTSIAVFTTEKSFSIKTGDSLWLAFGLIDGNGLIEDEEWSKMALVVSDDTIVSFSDYEKTKYGYSLEITGKKEGATNLTVTDTETGISTIINISVYDMYSKTYSYPIEDMRVFYPNNKYEDHIATNIYNLNGIYVNNYKCEKNGSTYYVTFDAYNEKYHAGAVDVYDKYNNWIKSYEIEKFSDISGLWDTGEQFYYLASNVIKLLPGGEVSNLLTYEQESFAKHSWMNIEVPDGGYFTISNNIKESPGAYLYNTSELFFDAVVDFIDLGINGVEPGDFAKMLMDEIQDDPIKKELFIELFKKTMEDELSNFAKETMDGEIDDACTNLVVNYEELLGALEIEWKHLLKSAVGVGEEVIESLSGVYGATLKSMFAFNKGSSKMFQVLQFAGSIDEPYATVYTDIDGDIVYSDGLIVDTNGNTDSEAILQVFRVSDSDVVKLVLNSDDPLQLYETYNICFVKDDKQVQPNGMVTVRIPVPQGMKSDTCKVYRQENDGTWSALNAFVEGNYLVFETDHFSMYTVIGTMKKLSISSKPVKNVYSMGETLDTEGLVIENNGELITKGFICSPFVLNSSGTQTITVRYGDAVTEFNVNVEEDISITIPIEPSTGGEGKPTDPTEPSTDGQDKPTDPTEPSTDSEDKPTDPTDPSTGGQDKPTDTTNPIVIGLLGDANGDGKVNVKDATLIQKYAAALSTLTEDQFVAADVNSDAKVNVKDATAIQKWVAGIETGFLIGEPVKKQ